MAQLANIYFYEGKEYTAKELYKQCTASIPFATFSSRLRHGWDIEIALLLGNAKQGHRQTDYRHFWTQSTIFCYKHKGDCKNCTILPEDMKHRCKAKYIIPKILEHFGVPDYNNLNYTISTELEYDILNSFYEVKELLKYPPEKQKELKEYWQSPERINERIRAQEPENEFYRVLMCYLDTMSIAEASRRMGISCPSLYNVKAGKHFKQKTTIDKAEKFLQDNNLYEIYKEEKC